MIQKGDIKTMKMHWCKKCQGRAGLAEVTIHFTMTDYESYKVLKSICPCGNVYEYQSRDQMRQVPRTGLQVPRGRSPVLPLSDVQPELFT